ncbi:MAG: hypothetical protein ACYTFW_00560 [Planctomycetota bacterium]|jgi:hypothetical protein
MTKEISVPLPEFLDVLTTINNQEKSLDLEVDLTPGTVREIMQLVENIGSDVKRKYYRGVVEKWEQKFTKQAQ